MKDTVEIRWHGRGGQGAKTAALANNLKNLGYKYATKAGTTISIADLSVPAIKKDLLIF